MDKLLTTVQARDLLNVSISTFERMVKRGDIPAYRLTAKVRRFDRADIEKYISQTL